MENNDQQPTSENPNQQAGVVSNSEEQVPSPTTAAAQTRLYECSFCKKGFSNAQALGGHMNIHRKDKAKLKQASKENQRLMDGQAKMNPLTPSSTTGITHNNKPLEFTTGQVIKSSTTSTSITNILTNKWPPSTTFAPHHHQDHQELSYQSHVALAELQQLPLFVETASRVAVAASTVPDNNINYSNPINHHHHHHHHRAHALANWQEDHHLHVSTQGSFGAELDLELRLGHEPPKPTVALGTRKFF